MTAMDLLKQGAIYFEKIKDGLANYDDVTLKMEEKRALTLFKSMRKEYGPDNAFVDFYYFRLDENGREMVDELLTQDEINYLQILKPDAEEVEDEIIFPLDEKLMKIVVRLNAEEMLFSTIYFTGTSKEGRPRTTWWANYDKEYVCFKDKKNE